MWYRVTLLDNTYIYYSFTDDFTTQYASLELIDSVQRNSGCIGFTANAVSNDKKLCND
jgi:hypothetical protein